MKKHIIQLRNEFMDVVGSMAIPPKNLEICNLIPTVSKDTKGHQMKKRFTEEQIIGLLGEVKAGKSVKELSREKGIALQTIYTWKTKFGDMSTSEAQKLRSLEQENARLKRLVADLSLDVQILKDVNSKKW